MRILIIEDETRLAVTVADLLEHADYTADTQKNGLTGLEQAKNGGYGLSLAIAQEIVRMHGGKIRAESDGERGNSFIVEF